MVRNVSNTFGVSKYVDDSSRSIWSESMIRFLDGEIEMKIPLDIGSLCVRVLCGSVVDMN